MMKDRANGTKRVLSEKEPEAVKPEKAAPARLDSISLSDSEREEIRAFERVVEGLKIDLCNHVMAFEHRKAELFQGIVNAQASQIERGKAILKSRGVDLNDPGERWNLDTQNMVFERLK